MSDLVGKLLGPYKIQTLLGSGSTGHVYRAVHASLPMTVAIKVLHPKLTSGEDFRQQFMEHAQSLTSPSLKHPYLVETYHFGEENGLFYTVTELVHGGPLNTFVLGPSSLEWSNSFLAGVDLLQQAADALAVVHSQGLIHGGIKPTNLLLPQTDPGAAGVKLCDVGLARLLFEIRSSNEGAASASPYASPEQRSGSLSDLRSDLYSLGAILYEVTTRRPLIQALAVGSDQVAIIPPRQLMSQFPEELESVILRCLATNPNERFASSTELSRSLTGFLEKSGFIRNPVVPGSAPVPTVDVGYDNPPPRPQPIQSAVPTIQVLDGRGNRVDARPVSGGGVTIGSAPDNAIILRSTQVSPRHVRIEWDGRRVTATDLSSATGTFLQGHTLLPQVAQEWVEEQWLHIGPYWIWLHEPKEEIRPDFITEVLLDQAGQKMTLTPGTAATCRVILANRKVQVDLVYLTVDGVPAEWIEGASKEIRLLPNARQEVTFGIKIPKESSSRAGEYSVAIRAHSKANPAIDQGSATATWTVLPFESMTMAILPPKASARQQARYNVQLRHEGNAQTSYTLTASAEDNDERQLEFRFAEDKYIERPKLKVELQPGTKTVVKLKVNAPRRWMGSAVSCGFTVQAETTKGTNIQTAEAQLRHRPIFPTWTLAAAPVVVAALVFLMIYVYKPREPLIRTVPERLIAGEPFELYWEAPSATRAKVTVDNADIGLDPVPPKGRYPFPDGFEKPVMVQVTGENFFGFSKPRSYTLDIKPRPPGAAPTIQMTVEPLAITVGDSVNIRWKITGGTRADSSWVGSVSLDGNYVDRPEADQTYTLSAFNSEGLQTTKTFNVKVEKPGLGALMFTAADQKGVAAQRHAIKQDDTILFRWDARNAKAVRIDSVSTIQLESTSGQKIARFKAKGTYVLTLVAIDEKDVQHTSGPIEVVVTCRTVPVFGPMVGRGCNDKREIEWK